jgi:glycosyltransferase involved in cell wall biosynthesis
MVADDGSTDGTQDWLRTEGLMTIHGPTRGVAWNKNRALYWLKQYTDADPLILLEDDTLPTGPTWVNVWADAGLRWQHVNFLLPWMMPHVVGGQGTADDPYRCRYFSAQCTVTSRSALSQVGFLDVRFRGYGWAHVEWTGRFGRAGCPWTQPAPIISPTSYDYPADSEWPVLVGELDVQDASSARTQIVVDHNAAIYAAIAADPIKRPPWSNDDERRLFLEEITAAR